MKVEGKIVDIENREIFSGSLDVEKGEIVKINRHNTDSEDYIMLGFVDAHIHIESSLLTPEYFGRLAVKRGTVATVSDPHEIANVLGCKGVEFMLESRKRSPININFTIPSCVPSTPFDSAGGVITAEDVEKMALSGEFVALSEVMNVPGVLFGDKELAEKISSAKRYGIAIDGHAPMLSGDDLQRYISCGISTDHESTSLEEAKEKIEKGMKILIREGSAAKEYHMLKSLIKTNPHQVMFCTDDTHPDDIILWGHIDKIVRRAIGDGFDLFDVLRIASINPIEHYNLEQGLLKEGSSADFIVVEDLEHFHVKRVYIQGDVVYDCQNRGYNKSEICTTTINNFNHDPISAKDLQHPVSDTIPVIGIIDNELVTRADSYTPKLKTTNLESDLEEDILKIVYINRYQNSAPVVAFIHGFGITKGAVASSISHDSHNIIAIGCSDKEIAEAVNTIIATKGGLSAVCDNEVMSLSLPIAGIMSNASAEEVAQTYSNLQKMVKEMGSPLASPFMTLSFLSLIVIPELKIGEQGLFSYSQFNWLPKTT